RGERRRQSRERQAAEMTTQQDRTQLDLAELTPVLDEVINELGEEDRTALLLRFFEQLDLRSIGQALGSSEDAARKRVTRALEKLHLLFKERGVDLSASALGTALATNAVTTAPAGFALGIVTPVLAGAAGAVGGGVAIPLVKIASVANSKLALAGT